MESEKKRKLSLLLLRLAAGIFGLVTVVEFVSAVSLMPQLHPLRSLLRGSGSIAVIGGADGPTAIYMTSKTPLAVLAPLLFALPPVFLVLSLVFLYRRRKTGKNT